MEFEWIVSKLFVYIVELSRKPKVTSQKTNFLSKNVSQPSSLLFHMVKKLAFARWLIGFLCAQQVFVHDFCLIFFVHFFYILDWCEESFFLFLRRAADSFKCFETEQILKLMLLLAWNTEDRIIIISLLMEIDKYF